MKKAALATLRHALRVLAYGTIGAVLTWLSYRAFQRRFAQRA